MQTMWKMEFIPKIVKTPWRLSFIQYCWALAMNQVYVALDLHYSKSELLTH